MKIKSILTTLSAGCLLLAASSAMANLTINVKNYQGEVWVKCGENPMVKDTLLEKPVTWGMIDIVFLNHTIKTPVTCVFYTSNTDSGKKMGEGTVTINDAAITSDNGSLDPNSVKGDNGYTVTVTGDPSSGGQIPNPVITVTGPNINKL